MAQCMLRSRSLGPLAVLLAAGAGLLPAGCRSERVDLGAVGPAETIAPRDFVAVPGTAAPPETPPGPRPAFRVVTEAQAREGIDDAVLVSGRPLAAAPPVAPPAPAPPARGTVILDERVGQINGKPVYAREFFEPHDARLSAEADQLPQREWLEEARRIVRVSLGERILDELLLAEFNASLTPEQRVGVLSFIQNFREQIASRTLGSESLADQRIRQEEGQTLDEFVQRETDTEIIAEQLRREVDSKVVVSWRDIERFYRQRIDDFQPPPTAVFRVVRVSQRDAEAVARVEAALERGDPVPEIAKVESTFRMDQQGLHEIVLEDRTLAEAEVFGPPELNDAARALGEGETVGPIAFGGSAWWIHLEQIRREPGVSLYEAQNRIERVLRAARREEETSKYYGQLLSEASISNIEEMERRLLEYAVRTYLAPTGDGDDAGPPPAPAR